MIIRFNFDDKDTAILERIARLENTDIQTYVTKTFKELLQSGVDSKHYREEILELNKQFPVHNELYEQNLKRIEQKYEFLD